MVEKCCMRYAQIKIVDRSIKEFRNQKLGAKSQDLGVQETKSPGVTIQEPGDLESGIRSLGVSCPGDRSQWSVV